MSPTEALRDLVTGEVEDAADVLRRYSNDASAFRIVPEVIVFPRDTEDLKRLVNFVRGQRNGSRSGHSLTARSCGTDMTGGPLNESIIVDTNRHLSSIVEIGADYGVVQPGARFKDFEEAIARPGLMLPSYPASKEIAGVGGMVANNSGGEKSLRYGKTEPTYDNSRSSCTTVVSTCSASSRRRSSKQSRQSDFEGHFYGKTWDLIRRNHDVIRAAKPAVSKNSTGYALWNVWDEAAGTFDLTQLFVGSQGTLGLISEIEFKLVPMENHSKVLVIYLKELDRVADIVNAVLPFAPTGVESYDDKTLKLALRFLPQLAMRIAKQQSVFSFALRMLPDLWLVLRKGLPKLVLMVEIESNSVEDVDRRLDGLELALQPFGVPTHRTRDELEAEKYWIIRRESFNLLRTRVKGRQTVPFIDDFVVDPAVMAEFLPRLTAILQEYPRLTYTIAGHAAEGNFHIIPLMDMTDERQRNVIPELAERVFDLVLEYGGSLSGEHNDGLIRGPYLEKMYGAEVFGLFSQVKEIFDPDNIFNPNKKTDARLEYALQSLKTDNEHDV